MKKRIISVIPVLLSLAIFAGCSGRQESSSEQTSALVSTQAETAEEPTEEAVPDLAAEINTQASKYFGTDNGDGTRTIVDMAGRTVTIPTKVTKVFSAVPTVEPLIYSLAPEKMVGWVEEIREETKEYLHDYNASLSAVGGWMGNSTTINIESLMKLNPDFILFVSPFTESIDGTQNVEKANQIQEQTGIPVVWFNADFETTPIVIRTVAEYLGVTARGEKLAVYFQQKMNMLAECMNSIPEDKKVSVYYGGAADGLSTAPEGGGVTEVLEFLNIKNAADIGLEATQGLTKVSIEQIIVWNPDVILASGASKPAYKEITTNSIWSDINAVKDGKVYKTPTIPFYWFDRPTLMRLAGAMWTGKTIYPDYCAYDLNSEIKEFFGTFFDTELTDEQVTYLLNN